MPAVILPASVCIPQLAMFRVQQGGASRTGITAMQGHGRVGMQGAPNAGQ